MFKALLLSFIVSFLFNCGGESSDPNIVKIEECEYSDSDCDYGGPVDNDNDEVIGDESDEVIEDEYEYEELKDYSVSIEWEDNSDNEDGFRVERMIGDSNEYSLVGYTMSDTQSFVDLVPNGTLVACYKVGSYNQAGVSYSYPDCIYF